jgi:hypothetical protein
MQSAGGESWNRPIHRGSEPVTWGLLGFVVFGVVVIALLIAAVLYCVRQIARW